MLGAFVMGHLEYLIVAGRRIECVNAIHEVVADVYLAVGMQNEVVHLRKAVADWPFGDRGGGQV